jgi:hypothetical protein
MQIARISRVLVAAGALVACAAAQANWYLVVNGTNKWTARFTKVPDFDQRRSALPNNGAMYCVPTAAINWMAYIAHHGYPDISPGDRSQVEWHSQSSYTDASNALLLMGLLMSTDAQDGTTGNGAKNGYHAYLDQRFILIHRWLGAGDIPNFDSMAQWVRAGVPVAACVGWYSDNGTSISRNGGHCFSVVRLHRFNDLRFLTMHDPADEGDNLSTNSAPTERTYQIETRLRFVGGIPLPMDKVVDYGSGYLDSYFAILPLGGLATSTDLNSILLIKPFKFSFDDDPMITTIVAPGLVQSIANSPFAPWSVVTTAPDASAPSTLWKHEKGFGFVEMAEFSDAKDVVFDRFGRLYLLDGRTIRCLDVMGEAPVEEGNVLPGQPIEALAADDVNDQLLALLADGSVQPYEDGLTPMAPVMLPPEILLGGKMLLATSPTDGSWFVSSENSPGVYRVHPPDPGRALAHEWELIGEGVLDVPTGLSVGDNDCLYVTDSTNQAKVFCFDDESGGWMQDMTHPLAGQPIGQGLQMRRSRNSFVTGVHDDPVVYRNELPTEFAPAESPCLADLNDDLVVDGADLGILLGAWGEALGDLNGDGTTDGADLGLLLGQWGDCTL